jgi:hypothetical protein
LRTSCHPTATSACAAKPRDLLEELCQELRAPEAPLHSRRLLQLLPTVVVVVVVVVVVSTDGSQYSAQRLFQSGAIYHNTGTELPLAANVAVAAVVPVLAAAAAAVAVCGAESAA